MRALAPVCNLGVVFGVLGGGVSYLLSSVVRGSLGRYERRVRFPVGTR
jgi:hypothetical protein